jgi:hypothetical protein
MGEHENHANRVEYANKLRNVNRPPVHWSHLDLFRLDDL